MSRIEVGLLVAQPNRQNSWELSHHLRLGQKVDILVAPEGYLHSDQIKEVAQDIKSGRGDTYLVTSMEDTRESGKKYQTGVIFGPDGAIIGEHRKTSLTDWEIDQGFDRGDTLEAIDTPFGKIGLAVCFELYFPEIARAYALQGARMVINPVGTGMWHERQYEQWNAVARATAATNGQFVLGVSHFNDAIPMAYAYAPGGEPLAVVRNANQLVKVTIDTDKYPTYSFPERRPELYGDLTR